MGEGMTVSGLHSGKNILILGKQPEVPRAGVGGPWHISGATQARPASL